jgi:hypothetical protein
MSQARDLAEIASGNTVASATPSGGLVLLGTKTVASGSADTTSMQLNDVFSADYINYRIDFDLTVPSDSGRTSSTGLFIGFGNSGTIRTSGDEWDGSVQYQQSNVVGNPGGFSSRSSDSCGIAGTHTTQETTFEGHAIIRNPFSSSLPHGVLAELTMSYTSDADQQYPETAYASTTQANFSTTDVNFQSVTGIVTNNTARNDVSALTKANIYGTFKVYGIKDSI